MPRSARSRRGGRGPVWLLLSALLVLAIVASSTLVFTNRVELLRLAVVLSLWAAVLAAFVSVAYRRQSQLDSAKARDMKYVYDLQLDREISARREHELAVEADLRRQLAAEFDAQAAEEMAALRAEVVTLRANLQALLRTDLDELPALQSQSAQSERVVSAPSPDTTMVMSFPAPPDRVESSRVVTVAELEVTRVVEQLVVEEVPAAVDIPIIDVSEEPSAPASSAWLSQQSGFRPPAATTDSYSYRGSRRRGEPDVRTSPSGPSSSNSPTPWRPPETRIRPARNHGIDEQNAQPAPAQGGPTPPFRPPAGGRHWVDQPSEHGSAPARPGRHRSADGAVEEPQGKHSGGAPVTDLVARLRANEAAGDSNGPGGRRRRED